MRRRNSIKRYFNNLKDEYHNKGYSLQPNKLRKSGESESSMTYYGIYKKSFSLNSFETHLWIIMTNYDEIILEIKLKAFDTYLADTISNLLTTVDSVIFNEIGEVDKAQLEEI